MSLEQSRCVECGHGRTDACGLTDSLKLLSLLRRQQLIELRGGVRADLANPLFNLTDLDHGGSNEGNIGVGTLHRFLERLVTRLRFFRKRTDGLLTSLDDSDESLGLLFIQPEDGNDDAYWIGERVLLGEHY